MPGKMSQWAIADGRLVKKTSNMLLPLVGNVTICESPNLFGKIHLVVMDYCF